jgi:hypothetical protein
MGLAKCVLYCEVLFLLTQGMVPIGNILLIENVRFSHLDPDRRVGVVDATFFKVKCA